MGILFCALLLPPAPLVEKELPPQRIVGQAPLVVRAKVVKDQLITGKDEKRTVPQTRRVQVVANGETKIVEVTENVIVVTKTKRTFDLTTAKATDAAGKKIDLPALRERLAKETTILLSADGRPVDESYRKLFKNDVIVIVAKEVMPGRFPIKKR